MKKIRNIIPLLLLSIVFSCTKIIDVDLNTASPQYVIQGVLIAGINDFSVNITTTTSYFNPSAPKVVENAEVLLINAEGESYPLDYIESGNYVLNNFESIPLQKYTLKVNVQGKVFEASAIVPQHVAIDSLTMDSQVDEFDGIEEVGLMIWFNGESQQNNYYNVMTTVNQQVPEDNHRNIIGDFEGFENNTSIFIRVESDVENGDVIGIELRAIDEVSFEYFNDLDELIGGGRGPGGASPANPTNNWSNGALGYFGAGNSDFQEIIWEGNEE